MPFSPISDILDDLRAGRMVVLTDDERRENEGDLVCAAERVTPETVNFMVSKARGVLCVAMDAELCDALDLRPQSPINTSHLGTAFTVTVDASERFGVTTGVSAADRAATIRLLADPAAGPADFSRPGHINPLRARPGGVLVRTGQTEGSVDLCRLAGLRPAAAIIEVMNEDGTMARLPQLDALCRKHDLKMCSIADIIAYRMGRDRLIERIDEVDFENDVGSFRLIAYRSRVDPLPHVALCKGRVGRGGPGDEIADPVLVRVHSQNLLGDVFGDVQHPSGRTLRDAMRKVEEAGEGAIIYMRQESMGEGLLKQLQTMRAVDGDDETAAASLEREMRAEGRSNIGIGSQILRDLGVRNLRLLANRPQAYHALEGFGLCITEIVPLHAPML